MNRSDTDGKNVNRAAVSNTATTHLTGSWLIIARTVWLMLVVPGLGLFVASLPAYYQQLQRACVDPVTCNLYGSLTAQSLAALTTTGVTLSGYAAFITIFLTIIVAIWSGVGFLIFWRRSDDWLALLSAFFLVMFTITYPGSPAYALAIASPVLNLPLIFISAIGQASIIVFLMLFPNGRLVPRWMGLFLLFGIISIVSSVFPPDLPFNSNNWPWWLNVLGPLVTYGAVIFSQIYRYRRVSTQIERQQTKWVVLGIISVLTGFMVFALIFTGLFPTLNQPNTPYYLIQNLAYPVLLLLLPLSIGIAILRYRLWDIDRVINRTLVYGTLTAILALIYFGCVVLLQHLVNGVTGQVGQSPLVIVASTLAIAALFQPLRHRLQRFIDRRFYRSKYDAAKIVEAFSATLRNEVELNQLREHLISVVQDTMQPSHISLWLREPESSPPRLDRMPPR
jgi:hypothetical protein